VSPERATPAALVIVPTHDHASTLDLAVSSALEQTVADLEVVVIGDGVGDDTREVMSRLMGSDDRVRFVDRPKSPSRGEEARHEVILASAAPVVTYLGDDDLFWPDHVETMLGLLADHDFAHPFPVMVTEDGSLTTLPTDLSDPACVEWHLHPGHNTVSLTGAAHTVALYRRVPAGWQAPPAGRWPDHYMWEQFFRLTGVRLATSPRSTTVKPPATGSSATPAERRAALQGWWDRMHRPGARAEWDAAVTEAGRRTAIETFMAQQVLRDDIHELRVASAEMNAATHDRIAHLERTAAAYLEQRDAARADAEATRQRLEGELAELRSTRTWRLHERVTANPWVRRAYARLRR
jgi:hypothetical protein